MALEFEWDDEKARSNLDKHGISFEDATAVFLDPAYVEQQDDRLEYEEPRINVIGLLFGTEVLVTFTMRGEKHRIISARKATRRERQEYWNH